MRSLEEMKKVIDQSKPEEEKKPVDYLDMAKDYEKRTAHEWEQTSIACSLIFIGEQMERIADALVGMAWNSTDKTAKQVSAILNGLDLNV